MASQAMSTRLVLAELGNRGAAAPYVVDALQHSHDRSSGESRLDRIGDGHPHG